VPSLAYRLAMVACGAADVAFVRPSAHDWDLAAADLIMHEAGARMTRSDGNALRYNARSIRHGVLVASRSTIHDEMLGLANRVMPRQ
jgi:myo-inositol-1(or 4)-monophosphatase